MAGDNHDERHSTAARVDCQQGADNPGAERPDRIVIRLALPVYVMMPGMNFFVFLCPNGYLSGRQYFVVVALRRLDQTVRRALRPRFAGRVVPGVAIAGRSALALVSLSSR